MIRALWTAASGMQTQQVNIDVIANNLANVNTTGFKKSRPEFQDLMYQNMKAIDATAMANGGTAFAREFYWSSTEIGRSGAWLQNFDTGYQGGSNKSNSVRVRAIRSF